MKSERPTEIKAHHLARKAVVYLRQSSEEQVQTNTGSTEYQRQQRRHAHAWGWQPDAIEVIDADLGLSGAAAAHRPGYQRLIAEIERGEIGAIFLSDMSRGGRNASEWLEMLDRCAMHQVLIVVDGRILDTGDTTGRLTSQMLAMLTEFDNRTRRETLMRGRRAKAAKGQAVSPPPAGYVRGEGGAWEKDPDPAVQAAIAAVFRIFRDERSCRRTMRAMQAQGVRLPRRRGAIVRWVEPQLGTVYRLLAHPAYKGEYHFGRRRGDPRAGRDRRGHLRLRPAPPEDVIVVPNHHEAYVTAREWDEVQAVLRLNGPSPGRRNVGPGSALLQGIIRCGLHRGQSMVSVFKAERARGSRSHSYYCQGDYRFGGEQCGHIAGRSTDEAVIEAVVARLAPPRVEILREAARHASTGERSEQHRRKLELHRAQQQEMLLEERFVNLDPGSTEIAKSLEARLEAAKREVRRLERQLDNEGSALFSFDDAAFDELIGICRELRDLWSARTTTNQDRKQILRIMIARVTLDHRDGERVQLRITWADGSADTEVGFTLGGYINRLILEMAGEGLSPDEIATRLNELTLRTLRDRPWERHTVAQKLRRLRRRPVAAMAAARPGEAKKAG